MLIQGQVGAVVGNDGAQINARQGRTGELITSELHGRYYEQAARRNLFTAYSAARATTVPGTALVGLQLWNGNPSVNVVLLKTSGFIYATSATTTGVTMSSGTGQIAAPTSTTAIDRSTNNYIGGPPPSASAYAAGTFANACTPFWTLLHNTAAIATTGEDPGWQVDFEGSVVVPPFCYVAITAYGAASAATSMTMALMWEEVPV